MIKIYVMNTCPDCTDVKEQVKGNDKYEVVDIGEHVRNLKEFLRLRDKKSSLRCHEACRLCRHSMFCS